MGNGAPKGELDGSGIYFNFMTEVLPFIFIDTQTIFPASWYQEPQSTLSVKPSIKSWQLASVLWFIIQRQAKDSTPQTISSSGALIFNSEKAYLKKIHF